MSRSTSVSAPSSHVGDEQARRVRPDVDDGHAHGVSGRGRGWARRRSRRAGCARRGRSSPARAPSVADPMCGTTRRFGACSSGSSAGSGSGTVTSSAAPPISPSCSARASASRSMTGPARRVHEDRRRLHRRELLGADEPLASTRVSGTCSETKSACGSIASRSSSTSATATSMSKPAPRLATACPMRPAPTTSSEAPWTSRPIQPCGSHVRQRPAWTSARCGDDAARGG